MEQSRYCLGLLFFILSFFVLLSFSGSVVVVEAYKNYTVGDSLGWYDTLEKPNVNYQKWVAGKNFSLGDFLIFNTDSNHSIIETYNFTTYKLCDYEDAQENDTIQWSNSDPSATTLNSVIVPVPLVKEGMTYFFSSDYDGEQCKNGQHFKVNVTHGQGLPKSLENHPSEESPGPISSNSGDEESAPDTIVPSNFNNPHQESDDKEASGSVSLSMYWKLRDRTMIVILVFLGLVCLL